MAYNCQPNVLAGWVLVVLIDKNTLLDVVDLSGHIAFYFPNSPGMLKGVVVLPGSKRCINSSIDSRVSHLEIKSVNILITMECSDLAAKARASLR